MRSKPNANLVLIDDDHDLLDLLSSFFKQRGYNVYNFLDAQSALIEIESNELSVDVIICDLRLPGMNGIEFIKRIKQHSPILPIILMTADGNLDTAIEAISSGAYDFVLKPLHIPQLLISVQRALHLNNLQNENLNFKNLFGDQDNLGLKGVIGKSAAFKKALDLAKRVSSSSANVIIFGESGSGKEVIARAVHELGNRKDAPFVALNCSAIPENLLESELFGHAKGAFTGAVGSKIGLFEEANKGTLFLDEIGDLELSLQAKLLRVLQERKIKRIGENVQRDITCRIICATHKDLKKEVEKGRFREDLYFRLNVIPIQMPPLRERKEDIIPLCEFFLKKFNLLNGTSIRGFSKDALLYLEKLPWKGNVRELENAIERAVVLSNSEFITIDDLPLLENDPKINSNFESSIKDAKIETYLSENSDDFIDNHAEEYLFGVDKIVSIDDLTKDYIEFVYKKNGQAKELTAKELGIDRKTLYRKLKDMNIDSSEISH